MWKPNVTVAAIIEQDGRFLLVEEQTANGLQFNQPAGHLDQYESILSATIREALEETAHHFEPSHLVGIYQWTPPANPDLTYLRFAFCGTVHGFDPDRQLDDGIVRAVWLSYDEIRACQERHRSPLIMQCIEDYLDGKRYPLSLIRHYDHPGLPHV